MNEYQILYYFKQTNILPEDFLRSRFSTEQINNACEKGWLENSTAKDSALVKYRITYKGQEILDTQNVTAPAAPKPTAAPKNKPQPTSWNPPPASVRASDKPRDYYALSREEEKEVATHSRGIKIMLLSFALIVVACFSFSGGMVAAALGTGGVIGVIVSFFMVFGTRSAESIRIDKQMALKQAELNIRMVQAGLNPAKEYAKVTQAQEAKKAETKAIVKGAVVGGIVAGDAGAVVGAMAAKNKLDNQNSGNSGTATTKDIVKGAVIGGIIAGDAGAVVGAMVAKNKKES